MWPMYGHPGQLVEAPKARKHQAANGSHTHTSGNDDQSNSSRAAALHRLRTHQAGGARRLGVRRLQHAGEDQQPRRKQDLVVRAHAGGTAEELARCAGGRRRWRACLCSEGVGDKL